MSFQTRIIVAVVVGQFLASAAVGATLMWFAKVTIENEHESFIAVVADAAAHALASPLLAEDLASVNAIAQSLAKAELIPDVRVVDQFGTEVAAKSARSDAAHDAFSPQEVKKSVVIDGTLIGQVILKVDDSISLPDTSQYVGIFAGLLLFACVSSWLVSVPVMRRLGRSLNDLSAASEAMAAGDYSVRVSGAEQADLLGRVAHSFNDMAEALDGADFRLKESTRLRDAFLDASPSAISMWTGQGASLVQSAHFLRLYGQNEPFRDLFSTQIIQQDLIALREEAQRSAKPFLRSNIKLFTRNGDERTIEQIVIPIADAVGRISGVGYIHTDITERVVAEQQIREKERLLTSLFDAWPAPIVLKDLDLNIVMANSRFCEMVGKPLSEVVGQHTTSFWPASEAEQIIAAHNELFETGSVPDLMLTRQSAAGEHITQQSIRFLLHDARGAISGCGTIAVDVTQLFEARRALERYSADLEKRVAERTQELEASNTTLSATLENLKQAQAQLVETEKLASLGGLVAGVAHEINTPIGVSVTAASYLHEEVRKLDEALMGQALTQSHLTSFLSQSKESVELIEANLKRASGLIRSFKLVAVDQSSHDVRELDLAEYLREVMTSLGPPLKKAGHEVVFDCESGINLELDPGALAQVVTNLTTNALTHAFGSAQKGTITLSLSKSVSGVEFRFSDNGDGIAPDVVKHIFDPFYTTKRGQGGSGLGLNIVHNIVRKSLGGTITCDSQPGRGTCFIIRLNAVANAA